jgi:hypothetical protein
LPAALRLLATGRSTEALGRMGSSSLQQLAKAYLSGMRGLDEQEDAFGDVLEACNDLNRGVEVTLALIAEARNEGELAYVAAGP